MKRLLLTIAFAAVSLFAQNPPADTNYLPNDGSTGTTLGYWLVMNTSGNAVNAGTSVTNGVRGLCITGCGTTNMAGFISRGVWPAVLDNTGVAGNWVVPSSTAAGKGHDTGSSTRPTSGVILGQVQGAAPGGMYYVALNAPDQETASGSTTVNSQTCAIGGSCTVTADPTSAKYKNRTCEVHIWGTGTSSVLQDTDDEAASCYNGFGVTETITAVSCWANAGSPTVTPVVTGGGTILTGALTCGTASFAAGTLSGTPTVSSGGSIDANITTAGGTATNIRLVFTLSR